MPLQLRHVRFFSLPMTTRFPFKYGIASLTALPHLFVRATVETDGAVVEGTSADGLPPKWFTKHPETTFEEDDLPAMYRVIRNAATIGVDVGRCRSFFDWWQNVHAGQNAWSREQRIPPLLSGFGFSLIERAVLDAVCRAQHVSLHAALRSDLLSVDLNALRDFSSPVKPAGFLPEVPSSRLIARHTIGLGDPLTAGEVSAGKRPADRLPFTLEENIRQYGLTHFKVKLCGQLDRDHQRLLDIAGILQANVGRAARFTLDGNENYRTVGQFREHWEQHRESSVLRQLMDQSLLFVEQPVHRDHALDESVEQQLRDWQDHPSMIIDESDAAISSFPEALRLGYSGTSHKNCKGIVKSLANAATVSEAARAGRTLILSAEDLANVGPVALLQDLAVVALLGIRHVERNGHHYFAGLSQFPKREQQRTAKFHGDLYSNGDDGYPCLRIVDGQIAADSVNDAPFGMQEPPDVCQFDECFPEEC